MSGYNPNNFQQGQFTRPTLQRSNSSNQGNPTSLGFNPNHLQQLSDFHNRQYAQPVQGQYVNYQYGTAQPLDQQQLRMQQQQYMVAAQQVRAQAQATQMPYRPDHSPRPPPSQLPLPAPARGPGGIPYPVNPMPMQRTFSNQSNIPFTVRPMLPVSGYQPHFDKPDGQRTPLSLPLPLTQADTPTAAISYRPPIEPKKKRRKEEVASPSKTTVKSVPIVYFTGLEKAREEPVQRENVPAARSGISQTPAAAPRRKPGDTESMRGSMRSDIARLMYAAGDVVEPRLESVNYVEDLVVEFMADLCRPVPFVRPQSSAHVAPPLTASIIRYRLSSASHPSMIKYASRFDYMIGMDEEIARQKAGIEGSHQDIVNAIPTGYLGIEEDQDDSRVGGNAKRGRTKRPENGVAAPRQKPGPKKGWKDRQQGSQVPEGKKRGPYKKRQREGSGVGTVKGEGYA